MSTTEFKAIPARPCAKCGTTERYKNRNCKACANLVNAAYRAADPGRKKAMNAAWLAANPVRAKATNDAWNAANPERRKATTTAWRTANHERIKSMSREWNAANTERKKVTDAAWVAANPERIKARTAAWVKANPDALRIKSQNRRAKKLENGGTLSKGLAANLFKLQKGKCPCCKQPLGDDFHLDHVTPLARGGLNVDSNMQLLKAACNLNKSAKDPLLFMQERGFLL